MNQKALFFCKRRLDLLKSALLFLQLKREKELEVKIAALEAECNGKFYINSVSWAMRPVDLYHPPKNI